MKEGAEEEERESQKKRDRKRRREREGIIGEKKNGRLTERQAEGKVAVAPTDAKR